MISLVSGQSEADFISACGFDEIIGARMLTLLTCYGLNRDFCGLWIQMAEGGGPTAAISRFDGWLVVSASPHADLDELSAFAAAIGEYRYVEAAPFVCKAFGLGGVCGEYDESHMMRYASGRVFGGDYAMIDESPPLNEFFAVITAANPWIAAVTNWSGWYTHTSHLVRHGLGFAALIGENGSPAAAGGVFTASGKLAVISCIATLPEYRGKGYASLITKYLVDKIISQGKTPALFCASDSLADYYAAFGFSHSGKWGQITL